MTIPPQHRREAVCTHPQSSKPARKSGYTLDHPEIPLHNNVSENDIRQYVKKRKIIAGTRSEPGRRCRDTFLSLKTTCRKLGGDLLAVSSRSHPWGPRAPAPGRADPAEGPLVLTGLISPPPRRPLAHGIPPEIPEARLRASQTTGLLRSDVQRDPEASEAFEDVDALMDAIRASPFLHGQSWFSFAWLFAKGKTGEWNVIKILEGRYMDSHRNGAVRADKWRRFVERGNE